MVYEPCPLARRLPAGGFSPCGQTYSVRLYRYQAELRFCASCSRRLAAQRARQDAQRAQRLRARRGSHPGRRAGAGTQGAVGQPVDLQAILGYVNHLICSHFVSYCSEQQAVLTHQLDAGFIKWLSKPHMHLAESYTGPSTTDVDLLVGCPRRRGTRSCCMGRSCCMTAMLSRAVYYRIKRQA